MDAVEYSKVFILSDRVVLVEDLDYFSNESERYHLLKVGLIDNLDLSDPCNECILLTEDGIQVNCYQHNLDPNSLNPICTYTSLKKGTEYIEYGIGFNNFSLLVISYIRSHLPGRIPTFQKR